MKGKKLQLDTPAVLPPKDKTAVSILRLRYCSEEYAVQYGRALRVNNQTFWGIMQITEKMITEVNEWALSELSFLQGVDGVNGVQAQIVGSPMRTPTEYVADDVDVFMDDTSIQIPMHADIVYQDEYTQEVRTRMRYYAKELLKRVQYRLVDDNGQLMNEWQRNG